MLGNVLTIASGAALIVLPAALFAAVLRQARVFGKGGDIAAAVVGGAIWGVLVGPGVMGRSWPDIHQRLFVGGETQRETLQRVRRDQAIDLAVLQSSGATPEAVHEQRARHASDRTHVERALDDALRSRAETWNAFGVWAAVTCVFLGLLARLGTRARCPAADGRPALVAGLCSSLGPGLVGGAGVAVGTGSGAWGGAAFGTAVGVGWLVPSVRARLAGAKGRDGTLDTTCTAAAGVGWLAIATTGRAMWAAFACIGTWLAWRQTVGGWSRAKRRSARALLYGVAAPAVATCTVFQVDPFIVLDQGAFWIGAGIAIVVGGDGRWTAVFATWRAMRPRESWRSAADRASAYTLSGVGLAQCIAIVAITPSGLLRSVDIAALALGAVAIECAAGLYRVVALAPENGQREGVASVEVEPGERVSPS